MWFMHSRRFFIFSLPTKKWSWVGIWKIVNLLVRILCSFTKMEFSKDHSPSRLERFLKFRDSILWTRGSSLSMLILNKSVSVLDTICALFSSVKRFFCFSSINLSYIIRIVNRVPMSPLRRQSSHQVHGPFITYIERI